MSTRFIQFKEEIDQLNLIYSAHISELNDPKKLKDLGFVVRLGPKIENKTPDFIFIKEGYALIIEAKSGSISQDHLLDLKEYLKFDIKRLEKRIAEMGIKVSVHNYDVGIVYYRNKFEESIRHKTIKEGIENLSEGALILTISSGGSLTLYSGTPKNTEVYNLLKEGIKVPKNPKREIKITSSSPVEGIIYKLILDVGNMMDVKKSIILDGNQIFNDIFRNYRIKFSRINEALIALKTLRIIKKKDGKYEFNRKSISDGIELIRKFENYNLNEVIKEEKQKSIDEF